MNERLKIQNSKKLFFMFLYYLLFRYLPSSTVFLLGPFSKKIRYLCCKNIFTYCGKNVNIERNALFGCGFDIEIGDNSGIGINCVVPSNIKIGKNVLMGPKVYILQFNHKFDKIDIPIREQGYSPKLKTVIEDDCWIGRQVIFTPGRTLKKGSIVAAGTVLCKDFPEYSIIGGNPSKLIKSRK